MGQPKSMDYCCIEDLNFFLAYFFLCHKNWNCKFRTQIWVKSLTPTSWFILVRNFTTRKIWNLGLYEIIFHMCGCRTGEEGFRFRIQSLWPQKKWKGNYNPNKPESRHFQNHSLLSHMLDKSFIYKANIGVGHNCGFRMVAACTH